jgi:transcriptional regulator with XRE-family HTH domain
VDPIRGVVKRSNLPVVTDSGTSVDRALGERIRRLRKGFGWTQAELSERLRERGWDIDPTGITRLEQGSRVVQVRQLYVLADAFGCTPGELLPDAKAEVSELADKMAESFVSGREWLLRGLYQLDRLDSTLAQGIAAALDVYPSDWDDVVDLITAAIERRGDGQIKLWRPSRKETEQRARLYQSLVDDLTAGLVAVDPDGLFLPDDEDVDAAGDQAVQEEIDRRGGK